MFMRTLFTGLAAVVALAVAMPVFAQTEQTPPAPIPAAKPKPGTTAYCQTLKSASSRSACLKRVQAQATPKKGPTKATAHKTKKPPSATNPPPAAMAPATTSHTQAQAAAPAPTAPAPPQTNVIPPLPQKTI